MSSSDFTLQQWLSEHGVKSGEQSSEGEVVLKLRPLPLTLWHIWRGTAYLGLPLAVRVQMLLDAVRVRRECAA